MIDPSAALFFSTSITRRPPAPGRFSTMVEDAYAFICSATSRAMNVGGAARRKADHDARRRGQWLRQAWRMSQGIRRNTARAAKQKTPAIVTYHATNVSHCDPLVCDFLNAFRPTTKTGLHHD